jgi:hypothetical protein
MRSEFKGHFVSKFHTIKVALKPIIQEII